MKTQTTIAMTRIFDVFFSKNADGNCWSNACYSVRCKNSSSFPFTGKEKDPETGYSYFGARYLEHELMSMWLSVDPMADKYPSLSPYAYCAWNPVKLVDPDGDSIDVSRLSKNQLEQYNNAILKLNENQLFRYYYGELKKSETVYTVEMLESVAEYGSGRYIPSTNKISFVNSIHIISQELFHAYQEYTGLYNENDHSVRETEGDIVSYLITMNVNVGCTGTSAWDNGISQNPEYVNQDFSIRKEILYSSQFDIDFSIAVDNRVKYYNQRSVDINTASPSSYIQNNSGKSALALKQILSEMER